jgi:hypothetical protein
MSLPTQPSQKLSTRPEKPDTLKGRAPAHKKASQKPLPQNQVQAKTGLLRQLAISQLMKQGLSREAATQQLDLSKPPVS